MRRTHGRLARTWCLAVLAACGNGGEASAEDVRISTAETAADGVASETANAREGIAGAQVAIPRLDDAALQQWFDALRAVIELGRDRPDLAEAAVIDASISNAENARLWGEVPELRAALEGVGLTPGEYIGLNAAVLGGMMGASMMSEEEMHELTQLERDNIAFVKANQARIEAMFSELQGMEGR